MATNDTAGSRRPEPGPGDEFRFPTWVLLYVGVAVAVTAYFIAVTAPMPPAAPSGDAARPAAAVAGAATGPMSGLVIPATSHAEMPGVQKRMRDGYRTRLETLKQTPFDPYAEVAVSAEDKRASRARRSRTRAYAGGPPTVPHPIDQYTSRGCLACHEQGLRSKTLRAPKMPHAAFANCTQCHVEQQATFASSTFAATSGFEGLPPTASAPRAYPAAPPRIPHPQWLREDCLSCHGRTAAAGLQTTHAWRTNCRQCHVPAEPARQLPFTSATRFLPPLKIGAPDDS